MTVPGTFEFTLQKHFPNAVPESDFVQQTHSAFSELGFSSKNTLVCVGVCRDEFTAPFVQGIQSIWGPTFSFSSLAGMLFLGKTGFIAAHAHAPIIDQKTRYVYYAMPHIAISLTGEIGVCRRPGIEEPSIACGALTAILESFPQELTDLKIDMDDIEQSLILHKLGHRIARLDRVNLVSITEIAHQVILEDLEHMISLTVDTRESDFAVITGIQIHGPGSNFIAPGTSYGVVNGRRIPVDLHTAAG